jgi:hypothetical protein
LLPPAWPIRRRRPLIGGPHLLGHCAPFFFTFSLLCYASASPFRHRIAPNRRNGHACSSLTSPRTTLTGCACGTTPRPKTLGPAPLDARHVPLCAHHEPRRRSSTSVPKNPSAPAYKTPAPQPQNPRARGISPSIVAKKRSRGGEEGGEGGAAAAGAPPRHCLYDFAKAPAWHGMAPSPLLRFNVAPSPDDPEPPVSIATFPARHPSLLPAMADEPTLASPRAILPMRVRLQGPTAVPRRRSPQPAVTLLRSHATHSHAASLESQVPARVSTLPRPDLPRQCLCSPR